MSSRDKSISNPIRTARGLRHQKVYSIMCRSYSRLARNMIRVDLFVLLEIENAPTVSSN